MANTERVVGFLHAHPRVSWVSYPTLPSHPASTTHSQLSEEDLPKAGVSPDLVRLSISLEDSDDILWDLDQALAQSAA